jgi:hypothetical protein
MESHALLAACLAALISLPLQAEVYQWTDEEGRVHYSDRPAHESAQQMQLPKTQASSQTQSMPAERQQLRRRMLEVYEQERLDKREAAAQVKQQREERRRQCYNARAQYENYSNAGSIYERQDNGERIYLDKQQREQYLAGLKAEVKRYCD